MKIVQLISGPRNISTAMMYSFAQRPDTIVLDEPFYAVYLARTGLKHPGTDEVLASQPQEEEAVFKQVESIKEKPIVFIKNMAHHLEVLQRGFPFDTTDIFLIRDPHNIIASYTQVIEKPGIRDIGLKFQYELFTRQLANGATPVVIEASVLLDNPREILEKLCNHINLPFVAEMLEWAAGPKPYDGIWAKYWYENVHRSRSFKKQQAKARELPQGLHQLYEEAREYYEKLLPYVIRP